MDISFLHYLISEADLFQVFVDRMSIHSESAYPNELEYPELFELLDTQLSVDKYEDRKEDLCFKILECVGRLTINEEWNPNFLDDLIITSVLSLAHSTKPSDKVRAKVQIL